VLYYIVLIALGAVMIFPLVYMFFASFKTNAEIFGQPLQLLPERFAPDGYINGWMSGGQLYLWYLHGQLVPADAAHHPFHHDLQPAGCLWLCTV
jgi:ABC-type glycerol-3-phosphate transport system permease component